jgi:hypothetical protein
MEEFKVWREAICGHSSYLGAYIWVVSPRLLLKNGHQKDKVFEMKLDICAQYIDNIVKILHNTIARVYASASRQRKCSLQPIKKSLFELWI